MAAFTLSREDLFPNGTSVAAYPLSNWPMSQRPPSGAPVGSAADTRTVAAGVAGFVGLAASTDYVAYAQVSSEHRYVSFKTDKLIGDGLPGVFAPPGVQSGAVTLVAQRANFARFVLDRPRPFTVARHVVTTVAGSAVNPTLERAFYTAAGVMIGASSGFVSGKLNALGGQAIPLVRNLPAGVYYDGMLCPDLLTGTGAVLIGWNAGSVHAYSPFGTALGDALVIQTSGLSALPAQIVVGTVSGATPQGYPSEY